MLHADSVTTAKPAAAKAIDLRTNLGALVAIGMCGPYLKGWVVGQSYHGRFVGGPIRRQFFGFSGFVHPGAEGTITRCALEEEQHAAHVVSKLASRDFLLSGLLKLTAGFVDGSLLAVVLARLSNSSASLL